MTPMEKELVVKLLDLAMDAKLIAYMTKMSQNSDKSEIVLYEVKCRENLTEAVNILSR